MNIELSIKSEIKAIVSGKELTELPVDLYIPPDALEVLLDSFSGPLDLLLYLIRKQDIDILDIPIVSITKQYLHYIKLMGCQKLERAADYLLMAAMLAEIKSRFLLPASSKNEDAEDDDPRLTLVQRLQAYEQIKYAAEQLDELPRQERDYFLIQVIPTEVERIIVHPEVKLEDLVGVMISLIKKEDQVSHHQIFREILSVRERMSCILFKLQEHHTLEFKQLVTVSEGRMGLIVSFLAILELSRQSLIVITQKEVFASIFLQAA